MFHVGLDIHTRHISICALDEKGQVAHRPRVRGIQDMLRVLPGRFEVCYEARGCYALLMNKLLSMRMAKASQCHPANVSASLS